MDYKEKVIALLKSQELSKEQKEKLENIFPVLQESEDERMVRELVAFIKTYSSSCAKQPQKWITWLEKQGEQPTDKVGPKLHEGDWIISNNKKSIYQVIEVKRGIYVIRDSADNHEYHIGIEECEKSGRLWSINDAKDGDVLYSPWCKLLWIYKDEKTCHVGSNLNYNSDSIVINKPVCIPADVQPATKEQRDLLFSKIKQADYEWDAEKKELKKMEPKTLDTDKVIDKACEWIHTALYLDHERSIEHRYETLEELLNDFRKAMEGD